MLHKIQEEEDNSAAVPCIQMIGLVSLVLARFTKPN